MLLTAVSLSNEWNVGLMHAIVCELVKDWCYIIVWYFYSLLELSLAIIFICEHFSVINFPLVLNWEVSTFYLWIDWSDTF